MDIYIYIYIINHNGGLCICLRISSIFNTKNISREGNISSFEHYLPNKWSVEVLSGYLQKNQASLTHSTSQLFLVSALYYMVSMINPPQYIHIEPIAADQILYSHENNADFWRNCPRNFLRWLSNLIDRFIGFDQYVIVHQSLFDSETAKSFHKSRVSYVCGRKYIQARTVTTWGHSESICGQCVPRTGLTWVRS